MIQNQNFDLCEAMLSTLQPPRSLSLLPLRRFRNSKTIVSAASSTTSVISPPQSQILTTRRSLLSGETTAVEIAKSYLSRIRLTEPQLKCFLHVSENVLKDAQEIDQRIAKGEELGPLAGVLIGVKDNICTQGMPSTAASRILEHYRPPFDATAVRKIKELGGIVVGKTNMDEFGMGSTTEASAFQVCLMNLVMIVYKVGAFMFR